MAFPLSFIFLITQILENLTPRRKKMLELEPLDHRHLLFSKISKFTDSSIIRTCPASAAMWRAPNCDFCTYCMGRANRNSLAAFHSPIINLNAIINITFSCQALFYILFFSENKMKWNHSSIYISTISWNLFLLILKF